MGRSPCCSKVGLKRGPWSTKEDALLADFINQNREGQWRSLPKKAGLLRCGKSCRLRWMNYLRPGIKRGNIDQDEEDLIVRLHRLLGNRWSLIAGRLPGRTDNEIKNYWNSHLVKKLTNAGIHPKPRKGLTKPEKVNKSAADDSVKKKKLAVKISGVKEKVVGDKDDQSDDVPKTKVYMPKAIRISPAFSRTGSVDSLHSWSSSSDGVRVAAVTHEAADWPVFEMEECKDDFLGDYSFLPQPEPDSSGSGDSPMLDQVYDEYLQLLLQN